MKIITPCFPILLIIKKTALNLWTYQIPSDTF